MWECGCGIWAFDTLERLRERFDTQGTEFCVGTVALWGKVIRTTAGFRAQFAYPQELEYICLRNPTDIDRGVATAISRAYGVPCVAMSPWRSPDFPSGLRGVHASSAYASITRRVPTNWRQDVLRDLQKERKVDWAKAQEEFQRHWVPYLPKPRYVPTRPGLWQRIRGFVQYWK